ncbi:hypothetical protein [Reticulibacter mediterranei]|uniref:hypothetical protein n=1 Tax=Reticulibacter mediterranei TaxID=2778369 RepID=UPI001C69352E|nr:hypothetical protein [Reticulibacter mediterranei]
MDRTTWTSGRMADFDFYIGKWKVHQALAEAAEGIARMGGSLKSEPPTFRIWLPSGTSPITTWKPDPKGERKEKAFQSLTTSATVLEPGDQQRMASITLTPFSMLGFTGDGEEVLPKEYVDLLSLDARQEISHTSPEADKRSCRYLRSKCSCLLITECTRVLLTLSGC